MKKYIIGLALVAAVWGLAVQAQSTTFAYDMSLGSSSSDVANLQMWLLSHGFSIPSLSSGISAKGYFGQQTKAAVIAYQKSMSLPATGFVGPLTRNRLNSTGRSSIPLTVVSPTGGEVWERGTIHDITWAIAMEISPLVNEMQAPVTIQNNTTISLVPEIGAQTYDIAQNVDMMGGFSYRWRVGDRFSERCDNCGAPVPIPDGKYKMRICNLYGCNSSYDYFTIVDASPIKVGVISPRSGERLGAGTAKTIVWSLSKGMDTSKVDIYLETRYTCPSAPQVAEIICIPNTLYVLDKNIPASSVYNWLVATDIDNKNILPGEYGVKVCVAGTQNCAAGATFSIFAPI